MKFATAQGNELPVKIDLNFGDVLSVYFYDDNKKPLVVDSVYLTNRGNSGNYGGSLNTVGPPNLLGADPSATQGPASNEWKSAYATISASSVIYFAPAQPYSTGIVKAKLVAVSAGTQREMLLDVN
jgi:hypothetical protein